MKMDILMPVYNYSLVKSHINATIVILAVFNTVKFKLYYKKL